MIGRVSGALSFERATLDIQRVTQELQTLQRQLSGRRADDLKSFSGSSSLIISARSAVAETQARLEAAQAAAARMGIQDTAITRAQDAMSSFRQQVLEAATLGVGRGLRANLEYTVGDVASALNTTWGGRFVFGGERGEVAPVIATSAAQLRNGAQAFSLSGRPQTLEIGDGSVVVVAETAETIGGTAMAALGAAADLLAGDAFEGPLSQDQINRLLALSDQLEAARGDLTFAAGRNGLAENAIDASVERLQRREIALEASLGEQTDVDLAELSLKLTQTQTQYEAIARVIGELRNLNLLSFLQ